MGVAFSNDGPSHHKKRPANAGLNIFSLKRAGTRLCRVDTQCVFEVRLSKLLFGSKHYRLNKNSNDILTISKFHRNIVSKLDR